MYEVIGRDAIESGYETLEHVHAEQLGQDEQAAKESATRTPVRAALWPKKPKIVQFNANRLETSMPYQLAAALFLGVVLVVLVAFRLGQINPGSHSPADSAAETLESQPQPKQVITDEAEPPEPAESRVQEYTADQQAEPAEPKGNNRIVIQTYELRAHLEPVKTYFTERGIETEIRKIGDVYYLVTKEKYENPQRVGTDGHFAKQKIIGLGAGYKAPQGYETFGNMPFHDAYGMRFDD